MFLDSKLFVNGLSRHNSGAEYIGKMHPYSFSREGMFSWLSQVCWFCRAEALSLRRSDMASHHCLLKVNIRPEKNLLVPFCNVVLTLTSINKSCMRRQFLKWRPPVCLRGSGAFGNSLAKISLAKQPSKQDSPSEIRGGKELWYREKKFL